MSAYIVHPDTIRLLVQAAGDGPADHSVRFYTKDPRKIWEDAESQEEYQAEMQACRRHLTYHEPESLQDAVEMLWRENFASVHARYPHAGDDLPGLIGGNTTVPKFRRVVAPGAADPVVVLKSIDCYIYQSCEHDGWEDSAARRFCDALRHHMIVKLPGYDEAPWGFESQPPSLRLIS